MGSMGLERTFAIVAGVVLVFLGVAGSLGNPIVGGPEQFLLQGVGEVRAFGYRTPLEHQRQLADAWLKRSDRHWMLIQRGDKDDCIEAPRAIEVGWSNRRHWYLVNAAGLRADCVPPLSIIVDSMGVHFDPSRPSALETLLQDGAFPPDLVARAAALRRAIVATGLSKYGRCDAPPPPRPGGARRHVLVPGQVEDDRAVTSGGALSSNLELLRRARAEAGPEAFLIYKPHPDVVAGHRKGLIAPAAMAALADRVETGASMASLIAMVDELHVNSSLAGFEALLRGTPVTVHGVPFYAGWGLTTDRGPVPARRTARRTLDELVAAALILYPRYLDPETGLPCPAEVVVDRLAAGRPPRLRPTATAMIRARRLQGRVKAGLVRARQR